jgi:hypothetical protein
MVDKPFQFDIIGMHEKHSKKAMMHAVVSGLNAGPFQSDEHLTVSGFQDQVDSLISQVGAHTFSPDTIILHPTTWNDLTHTFAWVPDDIVKEGPPVVYSVTIQVEPKVFEPVDPTEHFDID